MASLWKVSRRPTFGIIHLLDYRIPSYNLPVIRGLIHDAELAAMCRELIAQLERGDVPCRRIGRNVFFKRSELEQFVDDLEGITL